MIIKGTPISVDDFKYYPGVYIYICTHLHTDHTSGLTPSWNNGVIYCSPLTRTLLLDKFKVNPNYVKPLSTVEKNYITLSNMNQTSKPLIKTKTIMSRQEKKTQSETNLVNKFQIQTNVHKEQSTIQITLIDANHCPGAFMFLLEGYFGVILHTGDFRYHPKMMEKLNQYKGLVDDLYLDDTFCDDAYDFPSRHEAGSSVMSVIEKYPENYRICIATDTLGKEELLVAAAFKLKSLVVVSDERYRQLELMKNDIDIPDVFTCDPAKGRIYCLSKRQINYKTIMKMAQQRPTVGILPSGWSTKHVTDLETAQPMRTTVWRIPYSLHSSYQEMVNFVKQINPKRLFSTSLNDTPRLRNKLGHLCQEIPRKPIELPTSIRLCMKRHHSFKNFDPNIRTKSKAKDAPLVLVKKVKKRASGAFIPICEELDEEEDIQPIVTPCDTSQMMSRLISPPPLSSEQSPLMEALLKTFSYFSPDTFNINSTMSNQFDVLGASSCKPISIDDDEDDDIIHLKKIPQKLPPHIPISLEHENEDEEIILLDEDSIVLERDTSSNQQVVGIQTPLISRSKSKYTPMKRERPVHIIHDLSQPTPCKIVKYN